MKESTNAKILVPLLGALAYAAIFTTVILFMPADYELDKMKKWAQRTGHYLKYRIPCAAPESSIIGKWVRSKNVDCSKL